MRWWIARHFAWKPEYTPARIKRELSGNNPGVKSPRQTDAAAQVARGGYARVANNFGTAWSGRMR